MTDALRQVQIVAVPQGEGPLWVREAWVGVVLPDTGEGPCYERRGLLTGKLEPSRPDDLVVPAKIAVAALRVKNPQAAQWFEENINPTMLFLFRRSDVTPVPTPTADYSHLPIEELPLPKKQKKP